VLGVLTFCPGEDSNNQWYVQGDYGAYQSERLVHGILAAARVTLDKLQLRSWILRERRWVIAKMRSRFVSSVRFAVVCLAALVGAGMAAPERAEAIPVLANGQGVSCSQCHSAPPNLTPYGRYINGDEFFQGAR
jgi:hypothetical protein